MILLIVLCFSGCSEGKIARVIPGLFLYQGKQYNSMSPHIFSSFNELRFDKDGEKLYLHNCRLEYIGSKNLRYIADKYGVRWYALDDHFLVYYETDEENDFFSRTGVYLFMDKSITLPDFTAENISEIQECIGVPRFAGYDEFFEFNHQPQDYKMKGVDTEFLYANESISDPDFIKRFVDEVKESGSIKSMADEVITLNEDKVKKAQEEYSSQGTDNEKVSVYYKVCFKNEDFPFRLIFTF